MSQRISLRPVFSDFVYAWTPHGASDLAAAIADDPLAHDGDATFVQADPPPVFPGQSYGPMVVQFDSAPSWNHNYPDFGIRVVVKRVSLDGNDFARYGIKVWPQINGVYLPAQVTGPANRDYTFYDFTFTGDFAPADLTPGNLRVELSADSFTSDQRLNTVRITAVSLHVFNPQVTKKLRVRWGIRRNVVTAPLRARWAVRAAAEKTLQARWGVREQVFKTIRARWSIGRFAQKVLRLRWADRAALSKVLKARWAVRNEADKTIQLRWAVHGSAEKILHLLWQVGGNTVKTLHSRWAVRAAADKTIQLRWAVRGGATKSIKLRWGVRTALEAILRARWKVAWPVASISDVLVLDSACDDSTDVLCHPFITAEVLGKFIYQVQLANAADGLYGPWLDYDEGRFEFTLKPGEGERLVCVKVRNRDAIETNPFCKQVTVTLGDQLGQLRANLPAIYSTAPSGLLYELLSSWAIWLCHAGKSIEAAIDQGNVHLASGRWLDQWGELTGFGRMPGELDASFRRRLFTWLTTPQGTLQGMHTLAQTEIGSGKIRFRELSAHPGYLVADLAGASGYDVTRLKSLIDLVRPAGVKVLYSQSDFAIQIVPGSARSMDDGAVTYEVRVIGRHGFSGEVSLSIDPPPGFTAAFATPTVTVPAGGTVETGLTLTPIT